MRDIQSLCHFSLVNWIIENMASHSSTLAWKIPWTEEPGRLQSMGSRRIRHDWATSLSGIGEGNGNPLQYSCLENPRDGGAWWAAVYGVAQSQTRLTRLSSSSSNTIYAVCDACVCSVAWLCPTLYDLIDCSLPGSSVHGIYQARNTGLGCHFLSQGIFLTQGLIRISCISCIDRQILYHCTTREALIPFMVLHVKAISLIF